MRAFFYALRPAVTETQSAVLKLQERTTEFTGTLQSVASMVNGWKSDHDKLVGKVASTSEAMSHLEKEVAQLRAEVASKSKKSLRNRSRSPIVRCHCTLARLHGKQHLRKGDIVWICPRSGGEPTLKRYVVATNGRFSELSNDKAGKVPHGHSVRNEDLFVQRSCRYCYRSR